MPDSLVIPEIQRVKEKYPQYKDLPDYEVLQALGRAYPVYQKPLSDIDKSMQKKENWQQDKEEFKNNIISGSSELLPDALVGLGNVPLGRALRHGWGAVQAAVSGQSPVEGFKNPDQQQPFGVSYAKAENLDLNKPLDFTLATIADVSANILTGHLLYGAPVKAAVELYGGIKNSAMHNFHSTLMDEFKKAGASHTQADDLATHVTNKVNNQGFLKNNPVAVNMLSRRIKGNLGTAIVDHINSAKASSQAQGYSPQIFKRLASRINSPIDVEPLAPNPKAPSNLLTDQTIRPPVRSKFEQTNILPSGTKPLITPPKGQLETTQPSTDFGRQIQTQLQERYDIPLHTASDGRTAVVNFLKSRDSNPPTTQPSTKPTDQPTPSALMNTGGAQSIPKPQLLSRLRPAIKVGEGNYAIAKMGEGHKEIVARNPSLYKNKQQGFYDNQTKRFITRTEAAKIVGQSKPLHTQDLLNKINVAKKNIKIIKEDLPNLQMGEAHDAQSHIDDLNNYINDLEKVVGQTKPLHSENIVPDLVSTEGVTKHIYEPQTVANPSDKWMVELREKGMFLRSNTFNTKDQAINFTNQHPLKNIAWRYPLKSKIAPLDVKPISSISIPSVKPEELIKSPDIADEVLQRQGNQTPDTVKLAQSIKTIPTPDIPKTIEPVSAKKLLQQKRLQDIKERAEKYHPNTYWDVTFVDDYGSHNTMVDGPGLKLLEQKAKVVSKNKLTSEKGELDLQPLYDLLTNIHGELEKFDNEFRYIAKTFGNSFFIGEKYPPFKKVLDALQNPIDESNEFFYNGAQMLDRKYGESLAPHFQERVNQALNYGDSQSVQKYFSDQELKNKFDMSDSEIKAYQSIVKMYKFGLSIAKGTRKLEIGFSNMTDEEKATANAQIDKDMDRIGGYISHTRLGGDWAVYQPGDKSNDPPKFFDLFKDKSQAEKIAKTLDGAKVYLKTNIPRENYGKMSIHDLHSLAEAQDIDSSSPDYLAMKEELMKRTANRNWIRRNWVPRADQTLKDKYDNAIDYLNGQTSRYARVKGRIDAQKAFNENSKLMNPSLARYANSLMDIYFSSKSMDSNKIFQELNKMVYAYRLMFKTSFFLQHLTHPISVTYPEIAKGVNGLDTEKIFFNAYSMSRRYALHKITGSSHGLSKETIDLMDKLHKQGYLGDQLNRFQLDSRTRIRTGFEHFIGSMARVSEGTNRIHSAMAGMLKADHLGITDPSIREEFIKNFMKKTVFLYGRLYTPTIVTGAGNLKSLMNTMYRFRSFEVNYLHALASNFRYGASSYLRSIGGMTAMAGIKGAPFFALLAMAYAWKTGHTLDNDMRESAQEAHVPDKAIDLALHGVPSLAGADLSSLIGTSDIVSPYGDSLSKIGGASVGFAEQMGEVGYYLSLGDRERALEKATPDFISRILRGQRYLHEGIRKENGDSILANPSHFDIHMSQLGIEPLAFTKAYEARDEKVLIKSTQETKASQYNTILAKKLHDKDISGYKETLDKIIEFNRKAKDEDKINISNIGINNAYKRMIQGKSYPRHMNMVIQQINKRYGLEK